MKRSIIPAGRVDALDVGPDGRPIYPKKKQQDKRQFDGRTKKGNRGHGKNHRAE